ncbi:MAG: hypothetical protein V1725_02415 [archaeon]
METLHERLEKAAREELTRGRYTGSLKFREFGEKPHFSASNDLVQREITTEYNPEYETTVGGTEKVIRDIERHEMNHERYADCVGCPQTLDKHVELIFEPMAHVLFKKGYTDQDVFYMANAFEDLVLHDDLNRRFSLDGITDFYADVGRSKKDAFTPFYEAFVKLNLYLWGNKQEKRQLGNYFRHTKDVQTVLKTFLKKSGFDKIQQDVDGKLVRDRNGLREYVCDEKNWPELAKIFAEAFSKLMQPGYAMPLPNHSGKGTKGSGSGSGGSGDPTDVADSDADDDDGKKGKAKNGKKKKAGDLGEDGDDDDGDAGKKSDKKGKKGSVPDVDDEDGNPFNRAMKKSDYKMGRVAKAYGEGKGVPEWIDPFEGLDLLYQSLAKQLLIKVETFGQQSSMPIMWYGERPFNPDKDSLRNITFGFSDKGKLELRKRKYHEDIPIQYKTSPKSFPEIRFCLLDTSSSMLGNPLGGDPGSKKIIPWGNKSKYHYALLAWYGLLEYLKQNQLLRQTGIALANFSDGTELRQGLAEAKKLALSPQFGNTYIDMKEVRQMFRNRNMLVLSMSDGDIMNWDSIKTEYLRLAKEHEYAHFQIGHDSEAAEDMRKAGLYVINVMGELDLATNVIDLADKKYRGK